MSAWAEEYVDDFFLESQSCPCQYSQYLNMNYSLPFNNYCESGHPTDDSSSSKLYIDDPLWDGKQCSESESSCCTEPSRPWFFKNLNDYSDEVFISDCVDGLVYVAYMIPVYQLLFYSC